MGYESSVFRQSAPIEKVRQAPRASAPLPVRSYLQRKLERLWVTHRLKDEVNDLMRHAETLREAATGPPNELVVSLENAKVAVHGVHTELDLWGLLEVRAAGDRPGAAVETLLEFDISAEVSHHGITLDWSVEDRFEQLRQQLLRERIRHTVESARTSDPDDPGSDGPDGDLEGLLEIAVSAIDDLLEDQNVNNNRWRERARRVLALVSDLLVTLTIGVVAVGLAVLIVDEPLAKEMTKKVIEMLTATMGFQLAYRVGQDLRPPNICAVLDVADKGLRHEVGHLLSILKRMDFRRPLTVRETELLKQLSTCVSGHVYTVERLMEIADDTEWPQCADYVALCKKLSELSDTAVTDVTRASRISRWRLRRTTVSKLNQSLLDLGVFRIPDALPVKLPAQ